MPTTRTSDASADGDAKQGDEGYHLMHDTEEFDPEAELIQSSYTQINSTISMTHARTKAGPLEPGTQ